VGAQVFLDDATRPDARPVRVVVWGHLGRETRTATLLGAGAPRKLAIGPERSVLTVLDGSAAPGPLRLRVSDGLGRANTSSIGLPVSGICHQGVVGTAEVADPDGGLPWIAGLGQVGPPRHRRGCRFVGRLVGGRVATLAADDSNQVYYGTGWSTGIRTGTPGARGVNLQLSTPGGTPFGGPLVTSVGAAQVARRTLPGRTTITGAVAPGVVSVTLRTPRDIRTLRPTREGLILAVFDGTFYGGEIVATSHFRDGHTDVDRQPARFVR
jgi:hypothetical protein